MKRILVISAHADDETFGMGGSLAKWAQSDVEVHWLIVTKVWTPRWSEEHCEKRQSEIQAVSQKFDFKTTTQWEYQDNRLDLVPLDELQSKMISFLDKLEPDTIFMPSLSDFNFEHRLINDIVEMSTKPIYSPYISAIYSYEIPSSTDWSLSNRVAFQPNFFIDITGHVNQKQEACQLYQDENYDFPHSRSMEYVESLSKVRGVQVGVKAAEGFVLLRGILK